jgi:pyruvate dehydrogenase E1 component beta subunit
MPKTKIIKYGEALRSATVHAMERDPKVFVMGIGVDDHRAVFGSTLGLVERFGRERVFDTPIAEAGMTGVAIGAALNGYRPIHVHIRADFLYLAMDQIFNMAAKWRAMFGGQMSVPLTIRAVIGRSWGQGAQHSQSLQSMFMNVPGLKVAMPTTAADAQGFLLAAIADPNPVILIEHRLLYDIVGEVPDPPVALPFGRAVVRKPGRDVTIVANSYMVVESLKAAEFLSAHGVDAEIVDPVSLAPLDRATIAASIRKTGRLLVVDTGWITCGVSAEIAAIAAEEAFDALKAPVRRLGMQPASCPVSKPLENAFYPSARTIAEAAFALVGRPVPAGEVPGLASAFKGPF